MADKATFNQSFLKFLGGSPTPHHAVENMAVALEGRGFTELFERDSWKLKPGAKHFVRKNGSSLIAFEMGEKPAAETGFRMVAAHSDSPCLRLKPSPEIGMHGAWKLGVEVYGSAILSTWFDRDLSLAGRVMVKSKSGGITSELVNWQKAVALVPNLAIHLNRNVNKERSINEQLELPVIWTQSDRGKNFRGALLEQLKSAGSDATEILDYEISFFDTQAPALTGLAEEFISSARIDNLASCFIGLDSFLDSKPAGSKLFVAFDHEEVGSRSHVGAQSAFLANTLARLCPAPEDRMRAIAQSILVSADNAHGIHPNYADRMDPQHAPRINSGPVIKSNNNQSYATNARTGAFLSECFSQAKVPAQRFVVRTDLACGSTVGPIVAAQLGVDTVDVGIPQWAMHSCRETMGAEDAFALSRALGVFYSTIAGREA